MTKSELLEYLTREAKAFRIDSGSYKRNRHMHGVKEAPPQKIIDAVLVGFINHIGSQQGVDYGIYAEDLEEP